MANKELEARVKTIIEEEVGNTIILLGFLEYQVDLLSKLIPDLVSLVDPSKVTPEIQGRLDLLSQMMAHSSLNFDQINQPPESGKIPLATVFKQKLRDVQIQYFTAKSRS